MTTAPLPPIVNTNIHVWDDHDLSVVKASTMNVGQNETVFLNFGDRATVFCTPRVALHIAHELRIAAGVETRT